MIYLVAAPDLLDPLMMQLTPPTSCPIEMIVRRRFAEITLAPNAKRDPPMPASPIIHLISLSSPPSSAFALASMSPATVPKSPIKGGNHHPKTIAMSIVSNIPSVCAVKTNQLVEERKIEKDVKATTLPALFCISLTISLTIVW